MKKLWTDEEQRLAERAARREPMTAWPWGPAYEPAATGQRDDGEHFHDALLERTVRGVEAALRRNRGRR